MICKTVKNIFLISCLLALTGCVYLRLYDLKGQLTSFDENFAIEHREGIPTLLFKDPVMKADDVVWMTGLEPTEVKQSGDTEVRTFVFNLVRFADAKPGPYDELVFTMEFVKNRLTAMAFPPQFKEFLTPDIFAEMFEPIANADIRKDQKQTEWSWREMYIEIPSYSRLVHFLGMPSVELASDELLKMTYAYDLEGHPENSDIQPAWNMVYHVRNSGLRMTDVLCSVGHLQVLIDVSGEDKTVNIERR